LKLAHKIIFDEEADFKFEPHHDLPIAGFCQSFQTFLKHFLQQKELT
jgi:hypothetical protein